MIIGEEIGLTRNRDLVPETPGVPHDGPVSGACVRDDSATPWELQFFPRLTPVDVIAVILLIK